jgi:hypothetical protein
LPQSSGSELETAVAPGLPEASQEGDPKMYSTHCQTQDEKAQESILMTLFCTNVSAPVAKIVSNKRHVTSCVSNAQ